MACRLGAPCSHESLTQHHVRGGHGPLTDSEVVVIVIFDDRLKIGDNVTSDQFRSNALGRGDVSLARLAFATLDDIKKYVVDPSEAKGIPAVGASIAVVKAIREISRPSDDTRRAIQLRTVCVLDEVDEEDHDSHASLRACDDQKPEAMSEKTRHKVRARLANDLAKKFGAIQDLRTIFNTPSIGG
jgi:hypothetical protein